MGNKIVTFTEQQLEDYQVLFIIIHKNIIKDMISFFFLSTLEIIIVNKYTSLLYYNNTLLMN